MAIHVFAEQDPAADAVRDYIMEAAAQMMSEPNGLTFAEAYARAEEEYEADCAYAARRGEYDCPRGERIARHPSFVMVGVPVDADQCDEPEDWDSASVTFDPFV